MRPLIPRAAMLSLGAIRMAWQQAFLAAWRPAALTACQRPAEARRLAAYGVALSPALAESAYQSGMLPGSVSDIPFTFKMIMELVLCRGR